MRRTALFDVLSVKIVRPHLFEIYYTFLFLQLTYKRGVYHTSHDSVSVVKTTFKVYGKRQNMTLSQPKTAKPIVTKFEWRNYVVDFYHQKYWAQSAPGFLFQI